MTMPTHDCPACDSGKLAVHHTPDGLKALQCLSCHGMWVKGEDYLDWLAVKNRSTVHRNSDKPPKLLDHKLADSAAGKLCRDCGRLMRRVKVGHGVGFHLDRCMSCGGFWFDANEWLELSEHRLAEQAHMVFTDAWQYEVRKAVKAAADQARRANALGRKEASRVEEIRRWIASHPKGDEILARLMED
ncbi:MAG: zf-TFIIB domain-containing protein [Planctomycetota bacterium]